MKLTGKQIGRVASFVEITIRLFPPKQHDLNVKLRKDVDESMESWEKYLKDLVDNDSDEDKLPSYDDLQNDAVLDYLISYYLPE